MVGTVLGLNRRNLQYVKKLNPRKSIRLADNKYRMKEFLHQRGIPVPQTYAHLKDRDMVGGFDFGRVPRDDFVVKPNRGSKGKGIFIVHRDKTDLSTLHDDSLLSSYTHRFHQYLYPTFVQYPYLFTTHGYTYTDLLFKKKLATIVDGTYTLGNKSDTVLVEEKLQPGEGFDQFCQHGLADIRVIVCNMVPVAAMVRVPTAQSGNKANLAQGGIALGVDIATGVIKTFYQDYQLLTNNFPEPYTAWYHQKLPFWQDILHYSANIQYFVNMGFIGIDWVITDTGPKLLEVNGKAGLEIQNVSLVPLQKIIHKIIDLQISTPQKGVEIAKSLFNPVKTSVAAQHNIISLSQRGTLAYHKEDKDYTTDVIVHVDTKKKKNYMSSKIAKVLVDKKRISLQLPGTDMTFKKLNLRTSSRLIGNRITLGTESLAGFYIKPEHKSSVRTDFIAKDAIIPDELDELQILDQKIASLSPKLNLMKYLKPTNYLEQFDKFVSKRGKYNPKFTYDFPTKKQLTLWKTEINQLYDEYQKGQILNSKFTQLHYQKLEELHVKVLLLEAYSKQDYDKILEYNQKLYGLLHEEYIEEIRKKKISNHYSSKQFGKLLNSKQVYDYIKNYLHSKGIQYVNISYVTDSLSRISVKYGKKVKIALLRSARFREHELEAQLVHEIGTHVKRYLSGKATGWNLLRSGLTGYATDEEGLAIYQANQVLKRYIPNYINISIYKKYDMLSYGQQCDFQGLVAYSKKIGGKKGKGLTMKSLFKSALRIKRGIKDTSIVHPGTVFFKDKVYLDGYKKITKRIAEGNDIEQLLSVGKVKIEDLKYFDK